MTPTPEKIFSGNAACPLCGLAAHTGKCERIPKGRRQKWWCGICLATIAPVGSPIPASLLLANGVQKTNRWCVRCGTPVCELHRNVNTKYVRNHPRCAGPDCRARPDADAATIKARLEVYVPDFLTAGPTRCTVCALPAYRTALCQRHYGYVRRGDLELPVERQVVPRGFPTVLHGVNLQYEVAFHARAAAKAAGLSFSAWAARVIEDAVDLASEPPTANKYTDPRFQPIVEALKIAVEKKRKKRDRQFEREEAAREAERKVAKDKRREVRLVRARKKASLAGLSSHEKENEGPREPT